MTTETNSLRGGPAGLGEYVAAELARHVRGVVWSERDLQDAIEHVFAATTGLAYGREMVIGTDRLDFGVAHGALAGEALVAVEVKIGGTVAALTRQIDRYLAHDEVAGCVVVSTRMALLRLPLELRGKPILGCLIRGGL